MLAIQRLKKWQTFVKGINRLSALQFDAEQLSEYNRLAVSAIIRLISEGRQSCVFRVDPTGYKTIEEAGEIRKFLRRMKREGKLTQEIHQEECDRFRQHVRKLYFAQYPIEARDFNPAFR